MARSPLRRLGRFVRWSVALAVVVTVGANAWVYAASQGRVSTDRAGTGQHTAPVGIVLGASVWSNGDPSPWLKYRLNVAIDLYDTGAVDALIVSGDNRAENYNEPQAMEAYLVAHGVPAEAIVRDPAGEDTYASCYRANHVFGVEQAIMISQDFHVPRAVALCRALGVDAAGVGDTHAGESRAQWVRSWLRERAASVKAAWDVLTQRGAREDPVSSAVDEAIAWTRAHRGQ